MPCGWAWRQGQQPFEAVRLLGVALPCLFLQTNTRRHAFANVAFTSYVGIANLRDFTMELESGSSDSVVLLQDLHAKRELNIFEKLDNN